MRCSQPREYRPLQAVHGRLERQQPTPHYSVEGRPRTVSYEVLLQLSEAGSEAEPFASKQLVVEALCTNRDLPLLLGRDRQGYFTLSSGAPVDNVRCLAGPSAPRSLPVDGDTAWRLLSYLSAPFDSSKLIDERALPFARQRRRHYPNDFARRCGSTRAERRALIPA